MACSTRDICSDRSVLYIYIYDSRFLNSFSYSTDAKQFNCAFCDTSMTFCTHLV